MNKNEFELFNRLVSFMLDSKTVDSEVQKRLAGLEQASADRDKREAITRILARTPKHVDLTRTCPPTDGSTVMVPGCK